MKKNQKNFKKNKGIKKQMENIIIKKSKEIFKNIIILLLMFVTIFGIIATIGLLVDFFENIINIKALYHIFFTVAIVSIIYIIKNF